MANACRRPQRMSESLNRLWAFRANIVCSYHAHFCRIAGLDFEIYCYVPIVATMYQALEGMEELLDHPPSGSLYKITLPFVYGVYGNYRVCRVYRGQVFDIARRSGVGGVCFCSVSSSPAARSLKTRVKCVFLLWLV